VVPKRAELLNAEADSRAAAKYGPPHPGADASRLRRRYGAVVATNEKLAVQVPTDQPPSYQLELEDVIVGSGDEAVSGRVVEVHYVGVSWSTGEQFDASWDRRDTFKFKLGKGQVIAGWDQGVTGMKVGGQRRITIPPMLAYGKRGADGVIRRRDARVRHRPNRCELTAAPDASAHAGRLVPARTRSRLGESDTPAREP
jgi:peptidylprolyl isomerase